MSDITAAIIEDLPKLTQEQGALSLEDLKQPEQLLKKLAEHEEDEELHTLLEELDPSFILYMNMIECLMIISTIIRKHPSLKEFNERISSASKQVRPGTWESTVTESFFNMWMLFDVEVEEGLTLAKLCQDVAARHGSLKKNLNHLIEKGIASRIGIYQVKERDEERVYFEELVTGKKLTAICPTGYLGQPGETWLIRMFPPLEGSSHIIVTTPYCICNTDEEDWLHYFEEKGIRPGMLHLETTVEQFFNETSATDYWLTYIHSTPPTLETEECIHISGIPKN